MTSIEPGLRFADTEGGLTVFVVGMRINRLLAVRQWWPAFRDASRMGPELYARREETGFLGARTLLGWRTIQFIQYWRSTEDLMRYARSADHAHFPAMKAFFARARQAGDAATGVGLYHETYEVPAGGFESMFLNMPPTGAGAALGLTERRPRAQQAMRHATSMTAPEAVRAA